MKDKVEVKVRRIGNSLGVILPREAARRLGVEDGDRLFLTPSPDGYRLTAFNPTFEKDLRAAEGLMKRYKNALRELSKR